MKNNKAINGVFMGLIILFLSACSPAGQIPISEPDNSETPLQKDPSGEIGKSIDRLIGDIENRGVKVEGTQSIDQPFFTVSGKLLTLDGEGVQVFQYPDEETRENESRLISSDGSLIGNHQIEWIAPPHIWASGNLIVIYPGSNESIINVLNDALGKPIASGDSMPVSDGTPTGLPPAVLTAIQDLAIRLGIPEDEIEVLSYEEVTWSDSCLGLGRPEEACLQVITPGYLITLHAMGNNYEYHTDQTGRNIRIGQGPDVIEGKPGLDLDKPVSIIAAMRYLSNLIGVPVSEITFKSAEKVDWPDACLGLPEEGELCAEVIIPGWLIFLQAGAKTYELHTDLNGQSIRLK